MRVGTKVWFGLALSVLVTLGTSLAVAQPVDDATRGAARQLGYSGVEAFQAGDFKTASVRLEKAFLVLRVPSLGLWSARALVKIGKLVEARERYVEIESLPTEGGDAAVQDQAKRDARNELEALAPRVPSLVVTVEGAPSSEVAVFVDGAALPNALVGEKRPINPGKHRIGGRRGNDQTTQEIDVAEGQVAEAVLRFGAAGAAAAAAPAATTSTGQPGEPATDSGSGGGTTLVAWIALGVGGASLVTGAITGAIAMSKGGELDENEDCRDNQCLKSEQGKVDSYNTMRMVSGITLIAGTALAATGVVLLVTSPKSPGPSAALVVGPGSVFATGRF